MTTPAVVDWEHLLALRAMRPPGGPDALLELIDLFHGVSSERLASAREAIASGDAHALELAAHSLGGAAGLLRAAALHQVAQDVERHAASGNLAAAGPMFEALANAVADVRAEFERFTSSDVPPGAGPSGDNR